MLSFFPPESSACKLVTWSWNSCFLSFSSMFFTVCQTATFNWYEIRISWMLCLAEAARNVVRVLTVVRARKSPKRVYVKVKLICADNVVVKRSKWDHDLGIFHRWEIFSDYECVSAVVESSRVRQGVSFHRTKSFRSLNDDRVREREEQLNKLIS